MFATWMPYLIVFLPLIGAAVAGFAGKRLGDRGAQLLTSGFMVVSAVLSCLVLSAFWLGDAPATVLPISLGSTVAPSASPGPCALMH